MEISPSTNFISELTQASMVEQVKNHKEMKLENNEDGQNENNKTDIQRLHFAQKTKQSEFWLIAVKRPDDRREESAAGRD